MLYAWQVVVSFAKFTCVNATYYIWTLHLTIMTKGWYPSISQNQWTAVKQGGNSFPHLWRTDKLGLHIFRTSCTDFRTFTFNLQRLFDLCVPEKRPSQCSSSSAIHVQHLFEQKLSFPSHCKVAQPPVEDAATSGSSLHRVITSAGGQILHFWCRCEAKLLHHNHIFLPLLSRIQTWKWPPNSKEYL